MYILKKEQKFHIYYIVCGPFSAHKARYKSSFSWYLLVTVTSYIGYTG